MISAVSFLMVLALQRDAINVRVNGVLVNPGKVYHNRTMVPTRGVLEKLGVEVRWVSKTKSVIASNADNTIVLWVGKGSAQVNGEDVPLEAPPFISDGVTYVPLRFIAESMHAQVGYESSTNTATVDLAVAPAPPEPTPPTQTPPAPTTPPTQAPTTLGTLLASPSDWFIPGQPIRFEIPGPTGQDLRLAVSPNSGDDILLQETSTGLYSATWTPPQDWDYGDGVLKAMLYASGNPTNKALTFKLDDPKLAQLSPVGGESFEGAQLWVKMREGSGPGFDIPGVSVTLNGNDVTDRAIITDRDVRLNLPIGQNDIRISVRDKIGKQLYFDTGVYVVSKQDPYLTYDAPNPIKEGDLIRFRIHTFPGVRFSIYLGDRIRIRADQIMEVRPGEYEATYLVGPDDFLENAPVRAVYEGDNRDPLRSAPINIVKLRIDRVRGEPIEAGTLVQALATPGCRLVYVAPDGSRSEFTEMDGYPGSYLLTVPLPTGPVSVQTKPYLSLRSRGRDNTRGHEITVLWPSSDLSVWKVQPEDRARLNKAPTIIKASINPGGGPGLDAGSIRMTLDRQIVTNVTLFGRTDVSFQADPNLPDGDHQVTLDASDRLGRPIHTRWSFTINSRIVNPKPQITLFEFFGRGDIVGGVSTRAQFKVTGVPDGQRLTVRSSAPDVVSVPNSVLVTDEKFDISTRPVDRQTTVNITLSYGTASAVLPLTLEPGAAPVLIQISELSVVPAKDRDAPRVGQVVLSAPAPANGVTVRLMSQSPGLLRVNPSIVIKAGATQARFSIQPVGVDSPQVGQIQADVQGYAKVLRIPLIPAKLGSATAPDSVGKGAAFKIVFLLKSPMGPSGGTLKLTGVGNAIQNVKVPAGANAVTVDVTAQATDGEMSIQGELNGSKSVAKVKVN